MECPSIPEQACGGRWIGTHRVVIVNDDLGWESGELLEG